MKKEETERRAEALITPIIEKRSFELVDVEFVKEGSEHYLRAYIDKPGGITIDDCEEVSREFSARLDEEDFIDEAYIMEISSPGLGRPLKKEKDFKRSLGKDVEIKTYAPVRFDFYKKAAREYTGELESYDDATVTVVDEDGNRLVFDRSAIALIRLAVYF